jgi:thiosulfate dehydrogenase [quinone] large subunit
METRAMTSRREGLDEIEARLESFGSSRVIDEAGPERPPRTRTERFQRLPPGLALLPVRLFLGITFVYAGVQKLSDPGFLHPGAPTYIGTQLHQFANGTPGGFILRLFALPAPGFAGVAVALTEIAVGLLTIAGLATRIAALVGLALNLLLFLTNSWNTYPYFLGSDIVFVFAWLPFLLTGASGQPALDHVIDEAAGRRSARSPAFAKRPVGGSSVALDSEALTRRSLLARGLGATALLAGVIGGLAALAKGSYTGGASTKTLGSVSTATTAKRNRPKPVSHHSEPQPSSAPAGAQKLGPASRLPPGQAAYYRDPANGSADIVVHESNGKFSAHSAVCTHAGCTVGYSGGQLVCPCHGSIFDASTGSVLQGPAVTPLPARRVIERNGTLYAMPS